MHTARCPANIYRRPGVDQVRTLLQSYERDVITIFDLLHHQNQKNMIKEFRGLTHDFEKAVIGPVSPPEPDSLINSFFLFHFK